MINIDLNYDLPITSEEIADQEIQQCNWQGASWVEPNNKNFASYAICAEKLISYKHFHFVSFQTEDNENTLKKKPIKTPISGPFLQN